MEPGELDSEDELRTRPSPEDSVLGRSVDPVDGGDPSPIDPVDAPSLPMDETGTVIDTTQVAGQSEIDPGQVEDVLRIEDA